MSKTSSIDLPFWVIRLRVKHYTVIEQKQDVVGWNVDCLVFKDALIGTIGTFGDPDRPAGPSAH